MEKQKHRFAWICKCYEEWIVPGEYDYCGICEGMRPNGNLNVHCRMFIPDDTYNYRFKHMGDDDMHFSIA